MQSIVETPVLSEVEVLVPSSIEALVLSEVEVLVPSFIEASKRRFESASSLLNSSIGSERTHPEYSRSDFMKVNKLQYIMYQFTVFRQPRNILLSQDDHQHPLSSITPPGKFILELCRSFPCDLLERGIEHGFRIETGFIANGYYRDIIVR